MSRDVQIYCPCGARLTTLHLPDGWEGGDNYDHWMKCYNCGRDVAYNHDGRKGHAWYINNKSSNSYDDYDNGSYSGGSGSSGGCFITTAVCDSFGKADDCYELTAFRNFRDNWLTLQNDGKNLIDEYYQTAPKIVEKINQLPNAAKIYKNIWNDYLKSCLNFIEHGENQKCKEIYISMVKNLKSKFLG